MKPINFTNFDNVWNVGSVWEESKIFYKSPIPEITEPRMFLSAIGSASASCATVSPQGVSYVGALNFVRQDAENEIIVFNLDRYLLSPMHKQQNLILAIYKEPENLVRDHNFTPNSELFNNLDPYLRTYIQKTIGKRFK